MVHNDNGVKKSIYLDYHSTTPVDPVVAERVMYYMTEAFGNPSSITHDYSDEASQAVKDATQEICNLINCEKGEILFTSGATESVNLAIKGLINLDPNKKYKIATLPLEHKCVLDTCKDLERKGISETVFLKVDSKGRLDLEDLESKCKEGLSLVCVMAANNEIGNIYPLKQIGEICEKYNIPFLCDATQATGKTNLDFKEFKITFLAMSAHKMYGPKGIGALIVKKGNRIKPMLCGGGQQFGIRPGTLNVSGIVGLGEACKVSRLNMVEEVEKISKKRDLLVNKLLKDFPEAFINGDQDSKLAGNISISFPGISNGEIISKVRNKIAISTGSACSSGFQLPSHVLTSLGLSNEDIMSTLRIGVGRFTSDSDIEIAYECISNAVKEIKEKNKEKVLA